MSVNSSQSLNKSPSLASFQCHIVFAVLTVVLLRAYPSSLNLAERSSNSASIFLMATRTFPLGSHSGKPEKCDMLPFPNNFPSQASTSRIRSISSPKNSTRIRLFTLRSRKYLHYIPTYSKCPTVKIHIISFILNIDQLAENLISLLSPFLFAGITACHDNLGILSHICRKHWLQ